MKFILSLVLILTTYENCDYYHYLDKDNNIKCTSDFSCPDGYNKLISDKKECINDCKKDTLYKYEYKNKCYKKCPSPKTELINDTYCSEICTKEKPYLNNLTHECVEKCNNKDVCFKYRRNEGDYKDDILEELDKFMFSINIYDIHNIDDEFEIPTDHIKVTVTINSTIPKETKANNKYLNECEISLRNYYEIPNYDSIYFSKISEKDYEAYYKPNNSEFIKLDMSICEDLKILQEYLECDRKKPFENILTHECVEKCDIKDLNDEMCYLNYQLDETVEEISTEEYNEFQQLVLKYFEDVITSEKYYQDYLYDLDFHDSLLTNGNMKLIMTTPDNEMFNRDFENDGTIELGECENKLKEYYNIDIVYIKKIEILNKGEVVPKIEFDLYAELNNCNHLVKLNKTICENEDIFKFVPIELKDDFLDKYKEYSGYYDDICDLSNSNNDKDQPLKIKQSETVNSMDSFCEDGCSFTGFDEITKKVICSCDVKVSSSLKIDKNELYQNIKTSNFLNLKVLKCKVFNSKDNIKRNAGFYILLVILGIFAVILFLFYYKGYDWLITKMDETIQNKFGIAPSPNIINELRHNNNIISNPKKKDIKVINLPKKNKKQNKRKKSKIKEESKNESTNNKIPKNGIISNNITSILEQNSNMNNINQNNMCVNNINMNMMNMNNMNMMSMNNMNMNNQIINSTICLPETDYELNWLSYNEALKYDRRTFGQHYCSLIKSKNIFYFSFFPLYDYNSPIIKKYLFFLSFAFHYTFNAFLFNASSLHKIYTDEEDFNIAYNMPKIVYSSLIPTYLVRIMVRNLALTDKSIIEIKSQTDKNIALYTKEKQLKCIKIKFIVFFILNTALLIFFWYFLTCFNAVYKNSQKFLIEDTFSSLSYSLIFPFLINILPSLIRNCAVNSGNGNSTYCYKLSQILQYL